LLSVRVERYWEGASERQEGSLIDARTWNVVIINMRQGNVMHAMRTGLVSPVKTQMTERKWKLSVHALICGSCMIPGIRGQLDE
jgi:hypothetical protein